MENFPDQDGYLRYDGHIFQWPNPINNHEEVPEVQQAANWKRYSDDYTECEFLSVQEVLDIIPASGHPVIQQRHEEALKEWIKAGDLIEEQLAAPHPPDGRFWWMKEMLWWCDGAVLLNIPMGKRRERVMLYGNLQCPATTVLPLADCLAPRTMHKTA